MKKRSLLLLVLLALVALTSCNLVFPGDDYNPGGEVASINVYFEENGGTEVADQLVKQGSKITLPSNPVKENAVFGGWYKDAECTVAWDFENDLVEGEITLYAKWNKPQGSQEYEEVSYTLLMSDLDTGVFKEVTTHSRFTFNTSTEIRNRKKVWTNPENSEETIEFTKSVKLGSSSSEIKVSVPGSGVLSFYIQNGSSGAEYQTVIVTNPEGVAEEIVFDGTVSASPVIKLDVEVTEGDWLITRKSGTIDIYLFELVCQVEVSEEIGFEIVDEGKVEYIQGEELDYSDLKVQGIYANGKTEMIPVEELVVDPTSYDANVPGVYYVTVRYKDYALQSYQVVVYEITELTLGFNAMEKVGNSSAGNGVYYNHSVKRVYGLNEELDVTGLTVIVRAEHEGSVKEFITSSNISISALDTSTVGAKEVEVSYEYSEGHKVTCSYTVHVVDVKPSIVEDVYQVKVEQGYVGEIGAVVDGYNMFNTIKQALDFLALDIIDGSKPKHLVIGEGTYNEKLEIEIPYLTITGAGENKTIIEWDSLYGLEDESGYSHVTDSTQTVAVREAAIGCRIEDITISNYWNTQARYDEAGLQIERGLALLVQADQFIMKNSKLLGIQDTLELFTGRQYFENVFISGYTDFIFGTNNTTYFKNCTIHTVDTTKDDSGTAGYLTAFKGSNKGANDAIVYGAIFDQCNFTADEGVTVGTTAIGRTWGAYAAVAVMNSTLGEHLSHDGYVSSENKNKRYISMNGIHPTDETVNFVEYNNTGAGAITEEVAGMRFLSDEEAANHSDYKVIFGKSNGKVTYLSAWNPDYAGVQVDERTYYYFNQESSQTGTSYTFDTTVGSLKGQRYEFGEMIISGENGNVAWNSNANAINLKAGGFMSFEVEAGTEVMVTTYPGYNAYTINGVATSNDSTFVQYYKEATTVTILSTGDLYVFSVIVTPNAEEGEAATLEQIKVDGLNLNYTVGDDVTFDGIVVKAHYTNGAVYTLADGDYTIDNSAVDTSKAGSYDVVISYQGASVTVTLTVEEANADPAITENITLSFVTQDDYNAIVNNPRVSLDGSFRHNGAEYQIKGTVKFMVKAGTIVTVNPYANTSYASYTIGAEGEEGLPTLSEKASYVAEKDCTVVYTGLDNNYLVSIEIMCPVVNETYVFGSGNSMAGDYLITDSTSVGNIVITGNLRDNGDSLQVNEGAAISFVSAANSVVTITGHSKGYGQLAISVNGETSSVESDANGVYVLNIDEAALITVAPLNVGTEDAPAYNKSYVKAIAVATQLPISESVVINFGSEGNYNEVEGLSIAGANIRDNGGNNSQISQGSISFIVNAGATVSIKGYPGYTSYTLSDGDMVTEEITAENYSYTAEETVKIVLTTVNSNNYFYSVSIKYPVVIEENVLINFGSEGNYKEVEGLDISQINIRDNGGNNSQINNGSMSFKVKAGAIITVNGYPGYTSYTLSDGSMTTEEITDSTYVYTALEDVEIVITAVSGNNYFYSIAINYPVVFKEDTVINCHESDIEINGSVGSWNGLNIDATAGKWSDKRTDQWVQANAGLVITLNVEGNPTVTVVTYTEGAAEVTVENGLVTITMLANDYISTISISYAVEEEPVEPKVYEFDATALPAENVADKDALAEGTKLADYFTVVGTVTQRVKSGAIYAIEVAKNNGGALEFTVVSKATVTIKVSSTGGSNTSAFALVDATGNAMTEANGLTEVTGTAAITVTYTVEAGTYKIVSPQSDYGRGYRIMSVVVVDGEKQEEEPGEKPTEPTTYSFDATALPAENVADKDALADGTKLADYFTVVGTVTQRVKSDAIYAIEVAKNNGGALEFTVAGKATVTITVSSTGGSNTSAFALVDATGNAMTEANGLTEVTGTAAITVTYTVEAGTYKIVSPQSDYGRGYRIMSVVVVDGIE